MKSVQQQREVFGQTTAREVHGTREILRDAEARTGLVIPDGPAMRTALQRLVRSLNESAARSPAGEQSARRNLVSRAAERFETVHLHDNGGPEECHAFME